jgi:hypothetical protein
LTVRRDSGGGDALAALNVFESGSNELDANQWFRIHVLIDVARRPMVETGANVPSDSGGFAVWWWFRMRDAGIFCRW